MKWKRHVILALLLLLPLLIVGSAVLAQISPSFNLEWHVIASGGQESASANYYVKGTFGQSLASQPQAGGTSFTVSSGYWFVETGEMAYLPLIVR